MLSHNLKKFEGSEFRYSKNSLNMNSISCEFSIRQCKAFTNEDPPIMHLNTLKSDKKISSHPISSYNQQESLLFEYKDIFLESDEDSSSDSENNPLTSIEQIRKSREMIGEMEEEQEEQSLHYEDQIQGLIKNNVNMNENEKSKYLELILNMCKQKEMVSQNNKINVRKTVVSILQQLHTIDEKKIESSLACDYDSIDESKPNKLPTFQDSKSSMVLSRHKNKRKSYIDLFNIFIREFQQEMEKQSQNSPTTPLIDSNYSLDTITQQQVSLDIQKKYYSQKRRTLSDNYNIVLVSKFDKKWLSKEYYQYYDKRPLLTLRKNIVYYSYLFSINSEKFIQSNLFILFVTSSIIYNMSVFVLFLTNQTSHYSIILTLFSFEILLKLTAGLTKFCTDTKNIIDILILASYILNILDPTILRVDFTPLRLIRLLIFIGRYSKRLNIMIVSLQQSLLFLSEAILIVFIFTTFFALCGLHLFQGLFRLKCHYEDTGLVINKMCGYDQECDAEQFCAYSFNNPQVPTHFDNFLFSYGQIIRVMIYNDWTDPVYFSMRTFHFTAFILYFLIIFIAGIFCTNLIIAVLKIYYSETMQKYENFEPKPPEVESINLQALKQIKLLEQVKLIQLEQLWQNEFRVSLKNLQSQELENYVKHDRLRRIRTVKADTIKYLSARQAKMFDSKDNQKKQAHSELDFAKLTLKKILLPNTYFERQASLLVDTQQNQLPTLVYTRLKKYPILSWQVEVCYNDYVSTSVNDIFTSKNKEIQRKNKRAREMEFIKKSNPKQYYVLQDVEIQEYAKSLLIRKNPICKSQTVKFPFRHKNKTKSNIQIQSQSFDSNKHLYYHNSGRVSRKKQTEYLQTSVHASQERQFCIVLNGQYYNYDEIGVLINREIVIEDNKNSGFDDQEKYWEIRLEESKQMMIVQNNHSAEDTIIFFDLFRKALIYRALNSSNVQIWIKGFMGIFKVYQNHLIVFLRLKSVEQFFDLVVLLNVVFLCLESFFVNDYIIQTNNILTIVMLLETLLKIISQGFKKFATKVSNIFDFTIILCCLLEMIVDAFLGVNSNNNLYLKLMRALQAILFYRIIKYNRFAVQIASIIEQTINSFLNLIILMMFAISIFALMGMNLFFDKFPDTENGLLHSFNDFPQSFMAVFDRSTSDDWYGLVIFGTTYSYSTQTMLYCIFMVYLINFMTFGLVLAIILDGFSNYKLKYEEFQDNLIQQMNSQVSDEVKQKLDKKMTLKQVVGKQDSIQSEKENRNNKYVREDSDETILFNNGECDFALWMISKRNPFRRCCFKISTNFYYIWFMNLVIICSIANLAYEQDQSISIQSNITLILEIVLNSILLFACCIRIVSFGVFSNPGALATDLWRAIDFVYLISYFLQLIYGEQPAQFLVVMNYLRFLRPLRILNSFPQLQETNEALAKSLPDLINIFFVQLMVWFVFAIFGTIIYKDQFGYCENPMNFQVNREQCDLQHKQWITFIHNYDNIFQAISTLYVLCTGDGWGLIFQISYNSNYEDVGPKQLHNRWITYIFYFAYVMIGSLFFMGFFTGILFINFQTYRIQLMNKHLSEDQILFQQISEVILKEQPQYSTPPKSRIRVMVSDLIQNRLYKRLMGPCILFEACTLAMIYFDADIQYLHTLNNVYYCISCVMILDTLLKMFAHGIVRYFAHVWRKFEFFLSVLTIADFLVNYTNGWVDQYFKSTIRDEYFMLLRIFYILRNLRILLIIQEFKGLSRLLRMLYFTIPFLLKILFLFIIVLAVYALVGMRLFGQIDRGTIIDDYLNFTDFPKALLTLYKCSTHNGWRLIMVDCTEQNPFCKMDGRYCGQHWGLVIFYFYSYTLISGFIVLNLFVLALVEQFEKFYNSQNNCIQTYIENIDNFQTVWSRYSQETDGKKLHIRNLARFLLALGQPLGNQEGDNVWDAACDAFKFRLIADQMGFVHFNELLYETIRFHFKGSLYKGSQEGINRMKQHDREMRLKLSSQQKKITYRRQSFDPKVYLKGNFNILQDYLILLMAYRTWFAYNERIMRQARGLSEYTEQSESLNSEGGSSVPLSGKYCRSQRSQRSGASASLGDARMLYKEIEEPIRIKKIHFDNRRVENKKQIVFIPNQESSFYVNNILGGGGIKLLSPKGITVLNEQFVQSVNESILPSQKDKRGFLG